MKFTPASRAWAMMRCASFSSVWSPNIMVPRQIGETVRPLRPSLRMSIGDSCRESRREAIAIARQSKGLFASVELLIAARLLAKFYEC
jgi:hypothetical protein